MDAGQIARYARQIALPEIGPGGQAAICGARVLIVGSDLAAETARAYLIAAGVGAVQRREGPVGDGAAWLDALGGIDLVVRTDFGALTELGFAQRSRRGKSKEPSEGSCLIDDEAMLGAARRLGVPVIVARAEPERVDLIAFPRRPPDPGAEIDTRARPAARHPGGATGPTGVLAGALAAAEALAALVRDEDASSARGKRHLRLPVDGEDPIAQDIGKRP